MKQKNKFVGCDIFGGGGGFLSLCPSVYCVSLLDFFLP